MTVNCEQLKSELRKALDVQENNFMRKNKKSVTVYRGQKNWTENYQTVKKWQL
jgi:hypothetical protein